MNTSVNSSSTNDYVTDHGTLITAQPSTLATHRVLRNTYMLLSLTLLFSAATASLSAALNLPSPGILLTLVGYFGLLFLTTKLRNSASGVFSVFALTGFMGYTLGPLLNNYLSLPNGHQVVGMAMGGTGAIFIGLSAYVLATKRDFSALRGMLFVGVIMAFVASLAAIFFAIPTLSLTVSVAMVLLMSGMILYETSNIIHGGETNYVMATVGLFVSVFNLFVSLMQLLGFMSADE